ncbi:MAG: hypothetical protein ACRCZE_05260 [Candidatus Altimarinota bacterium]
MQRIKGSRNGYFELEAEDGLSTFSGKLIKLMELIDWEAYSERELPRVVADYLGEERAKNYELMQLMLRLVKDYMKGPADFSLLAEKILEKCDDNDEAEQLMMEIEENLRILNEEKEYSIDTFRIESELRVKLREAGKMGITEQERKLLMEPVLMEEAGEISSAREMVKERVEAALDLIKKNTKIKFFNHNLDLIEKEKEHLKSIKKFAKSRLKK